MSDKKTIAVVGATGAQGGGLVRAILADAAGGFAARAITRNVKSETARKLADAGAEVVEADLQNAASVAQAFKGAHGAFCVTFFWDHFSPERELSDARVLAEAARKEKVAHVVWSTLEDSRKFIPLSDNRMPTLGGKYKVPHFDAKGEADAFFADLPTTYLLTSFYWDNLIHFGMNPKPDGAGGYLFTLPMDDKKLPGIAAEDIGRCAYGVFREGAPHIGKYVGIAGEHLTGAEMAATLSEVLGAKVRHNAVSPAEYRALGFPGADDLGNMFQFNRDFSDQFRAARPIEASRRLNPSLQTFRAWVQANKSRIPLT